jgi:hypothetical protein
MKLLHFDFFDEFRSKNGLPASKNKTMSACQFNKLNQSEVFVTHM